MSTAKNTQLGPKFPYYVAKHDKSVHAALKHPAGYEDAHPEEYEGTNSASTADYEKSRLEAQQNAAIDRSGYFAPMVANTPIGTAEEPLPATSLVYAAPGGQAAGPGAGETSLRPNEMGGQVVVGGADRNQTRASGEAPEPVEGTVNPADVAKAQIDANKQAVKELADATKPHKASTKKAASKKASTK